VNETTTNDSYALFQFLSMVIWWGSVIGSYLIAQHKGRNRFGWTITSCFLPLITLIVVALLRSKRDRRMMAP
jgi:hypothetical protein